MRKYLLLAVFCLLTFSLFAKVVPIDKAKEVALSFLQHNQHSTLKSTTSLNLVYLGDVTSRKLALSNSLKSADIESPELHFFSINDSSGFIVVSGDDAAVPILGYSYDAKIKATNLPSNFLKWVEGYKQQIIYLRANSIKQTPVIKDLWNGKSDALKSVNKSVSPLILTQWDQAPHVNNKCPYDNNYRELTVTGCPATAMAQIMKFWKYPSKGVGFHSYQHNKYGTLSANFGETSYNWDAMPNTINSTNDAVALLMYHCGVAVEMNYNVASEGGSGSYVIVDPYNRYSETQTVEYALKTYFGYDASIRGLQRDSYSDNEWKNILKAELDARRPIQYAGYGQGGHTFVCDGYDQNSYFHMNWGWGGYYDAFFLLDALNPGAGGIGSGGASYNEGQQALIGIKPANSSTPENPVQTVDMQLYDNVTASNYTITYIDAFTVHSDILNAGSTTFSGDYCAAVFDNNDAFIDFVEIKTGVSLSAGYHYIDGITFSSEGLLSMLPGSYRVYIFARPTDGEWICLSAAPDDYLTQGFAEMDVVYENDISLYSTINVLTEEIFSGGKLSVNLDIANFSDYDFTGIFDVSLYDLNGDFVATIEEKFDMNLNSNNHYINGLTFTTNSLNVEPGTYLLALMHQWDGYDYELTGSSDTYVNPIKVIVRGKPLVKDMYENNDAFGDAYKFNLSYSNNSAKVVTNGSNIHVGSDWDFYSIKLDAGYDYSINARLHDAYSSANGNEYSVDGLFLYSTDGENWSDIFDDVMPGSIVITGGRTICFVVSPYFLGETGSYLFDVNVERQSPNAVEIVDAKNNLSLFPNPGVDWVTISGNDNLLHYQLFSVDGKLLKKEEINGQTYNLDVSSLHRGAYILKIASDKKIYTEKLIKE